MEVHSFDKSNPTPPQALQLSSVLTSVCLGVRVTGKERFYLQPTYAAAAPTLLGGRSELPPPTPPRNHCWGALGWGMGARPVSALPSWVSTHFSPPTLQAPLSFTSGCFISISLHSCFSLISSPLASRAEPFIAQRM